MKITEKTKKQEFISYLQAAEISDKNLAERVAYALNMVAKDMTKVAKADLAELVTEVMGLTPAPTPAPTEASLKPKLAKKSEAPAPKTEEKSDKTPKKEKTAPAPKSKEKTEKPEKKKKDESPIETIPPASNKGTDNLPSAKIFPAEIDHPDLGKLVSCAGQYTTYAEIVKALEEGKTIYFACYWTKRQIKEFSYEATKMVKVPKNGFPLDLDILLAVLPCETVERLYTMSQYTEALFQFEGEDFMPIEDTDPRSGDKFSIRVSAGMEFEIYRPENEEVTESSDDEGADEE